MVKNKYDKKLETHYLISGPAPMGRILNYIKKIKKGEYKRSYRGEVRDKYNLDNWTISFMVGLGLIRPPKYTPRFKVELTTNGERLYEFLKQVKKAFSETTDRLHIEEIRKEIKITDPLFYQEFKRMVLSSAPIRNVAVYLERKRRKKISKRVFYNEFGRDFGLDVAAFNRLPSLLQIAEFFDILTTDKGDIEIIDNDFVDQRRIFDDTEVVKRQVRKRGSAITFDNPEDYDFLCDRSPSVDTRRKINRIIKIIRRNRKVVDKLKLLYKSKCQICGKTFKTKKGAFYSEAHHFIPLGEEGDDASNNILILCPTCHKKLHYAECKVDKKTKNKIHIYMAGQKKSISFDPKHFRIFEISESKLSIIKPER